MEWLENTREFQERIENTSASIERGMGTRSVPMTIALQRIQQCVDKRLDLSKLGLTELPPLPDDLIVLRCDLNELTSLPTLPSSLRVLHCHQNQLSSLPKLPPLLESLSCSHNHLTSLPFLPSSLKQLVCMRNHLTTLPYLPLFLQELSFDNNEITHLPTLPTLTSLSCCRNLLTSLTSLPHGLTSLFCFDNPLETFPELPSTLVYLVCTLPHTKERYAPLRLTPEQIQQVNRENQEWDEAQSMERCMKRCSVYYEDLMHNRWNPDRVFQLRDRGYNPSDM
jgi:hypothetical protein